MMLDIALKMTAFSQHTYARHGVVVTRGGAIIAKGYNHKNRHAERVALDKLWGGQGRNQNQRNGVVVWSIRLTPGGKLASAKPCDECEKFMRANGVKLVFYSNSLGEIVRMKL